MVLIIFKFPSSNFFFFPNIHFLEEVPPSVNWLAWFLSPRIQNLPQDDRNNLTKTLIVCVGTFFSAKMWEVRQNQVTLMLLKARTKFLSRLLAMSPLSKGENETRTPEWMLGNDQIANWQYQYFCCSCQWILWQDTKPGRLNLWFHDYLVLHQWVRAVMHFGKDLFYKLTKKF